MESIKVSLGIGNLGLINSGVESLAVVFAVVVAVGRIEQLDHIGSVVVVHDPTVTSHLIVTGAALRSEGRPVNNIDLHGDAKLLLVDLLKILSNSLVVAGIVGRISDGREALTVGIACLCESLLSLGEVSLIVLADIGAAAVCCDSVVKEHAVAAVNDAGSDIVVSRAVGTLHDSVGNILTVNSKAESLTDIDIVEGSLIKIHAEVISAEGRIDIEVAAVG